MTYKAMKYVTKEERPDWISDAQEPPPNMRPVDAAKFWLDFHNFIPEGVMYHSWWQGERDTPQEVYKKAILFIYSGNEGYGMVTASGNMRHTKLHAPPTEYFSFGKCIHAFRDKVIGNCLTEYTCQKCGYSHTVDSSD